MGNSDSRTDPTELGFLISIGYPLKASVRASRVHCRMASPACHPWHPGSPSIGYGSYCQDRCFGLPLSVKGSATPLCISRLHPGSLALRPAGLLSSLSEPLSGNLALQVTLNPSLKLYGWTTKFPRSDFNRQVIRFTRHTTELNTNSCHASFQITSIGPMLRTTPKKVSTPGPFNLVSILSLLFKIMGLRNTYP